jgi:hypothetical protein
MVGEYPMRINPMFEYIVNRQRQFSPRLPYEMHNVSVGCIRLPDENNRVSLGEFENAFAAKDQALIFYPEVEGCYYCCDNCNNAVQDFLRQAKDVRLKW